MCDEELLVKCIAGQFAYYRTLYYHGSITKKEYQEALEDLLFFLRKMRRMLGI